MKYKLKVYSIWEYGQRKDSDGNPHQEDSIFPAFGQQKDSDRTFILCDGMGGHDAEGVFTDQDLLDAVEDAFDALDKKDTGAEKKMGTTLAFLKLHNAGATIAHMGDSRVYHIRPGKNGDSTQILHVTPDHSLVNYLIKSGELTPDEARQSKQKNIITKALQPNMDQRPKAEVYHTADIKAGDFFYLCSDGMLEDPDMENGETLKNIFSLQGGPDERRVEILTKVTKDNNDNHTALIIHVQDVFEESATVNHKAKTTPESHTSRPVATQQKQSKQGRSKGMFWFIIMAIVIAAGIIGFSYLRAEKENDEKAEAPIEQKTTPSVSTKGQPQEIKLIEEVPAVMVNTESEENPAQQSDTL